MEAARLRAQVRATAARKKEEKKGKEKEGASSSAPKAVTKGAAKRKGDGKDDRSSKKASVAPGEKLPMKPSPPQPKHGAGKGLMTTSSPVVRILTIVFSLTRIMPWRWWSPSSRTRMLTLVLSKGRMS